MPFGQVSWFCTLLKWATVVSTDCRTTLVKKGASILRCITAKHLSYGGILITNLLLHESNGESESLSAYYGEDTGNRR